MKRKIVTAILFLLLLFVCIINFSCNFLRDNNSPEIEIPISKTPTLPPSIQVAVNNWNSLFGTHVQVTGWSFIETIVNDTQKESIIQQLIDPNQNYIATGDPYNPGTITAILLSEELSGKPPELIEQWINMINTIVQVGLHIIQVDWEFNNSTQTFTTILIADDSNFIFDSMLSSVFIVNRSDPDGFKEYKNIDCDIKMSVIFTWSLNPFCFDGKVLSCDYHCDSIVSSKKDFGQARIWCKDEKLNDYCCKLYYAYAYASVGGILKATWNDSNKQFDLDIRPVGVSDTGHGSLTKCCPTPTPDTGQGTCPPTSLPSAVPTPSPAPT